MTNWTQLIPAKLRTALYIGFGILSLAQTGILAYTAAVGQTAPIWAIGGGAVLGVIGGAFGFVAAGNTNVSPAPDGKYEAGRAEDRAPIPGTTLDLGATERLSHDTE